MLSYTPRMPVNRLQALRLHLATAGLSPLLLAQGRWVRRRMPILREPVGDREGRLGSGPPLSLVILGDSAAAGVGVDSQADALAGQLTQRLAGEHTISWQLLARTGFRAEDSLRLLHQQTQLRCDVALTSLGVNDATALASPRRFGHTMYKLIDHLRSRCGARHVLLSGLPPLGQFPALPTPLRWRLGQQAHLLDEQLRLLAASSRFCEHIPFGVLADHSFIASDGFHPGKKAYLAWADAAASRIAAWQRRANLDRDR